MDLLVSAHRFGSEIPSAHQRAQDFDDVCYCSCDFQINYRSQTGRRLEGTPCLNRCLITLFIIYLLAALVPLYWAR